MVTDSESADRDGGKRRRPSIGELIYRVGRVVMVAVLFVLIFLLGLSMVHHRFFRGGRYHANGSVGQ